MLNYHEFWENSLVNECLRGIWLFMSEENGKKFFSGKNEAFRLFDKVISLSLTVASGLALLVFAGSRIDREFGTGNIFLIVFSVWGFAASMVYLFLMMRKGKL